MHIERSVMDKLLVDEFTPGEDAERWSFDRIPQMPLLGFITGSAFSGAIWLAAWLVLKLVG